MNYKIVVFFVLLCSPSVIDVFGQESSRNLTAEYCANNWKVDPVRCSEYVPKGYQPSQSQAIPQYNVKTSNCPSGTHYGTDANGPACITDQIVNSTNISSSVSNSGDNGTIIAVVVIFFIIIIIAGIMKSRGKSKTVEYKDVERKTFTYATREKIKELQEGKCAECERYPTHWEFDHKDTRGDNSIENCQGLCRDCHQKKTLDDNWRNTRN